MIHHSLRSIALVVILSYASQASAVLVLSETFGYADGSLVGATGSPWTTNSGTAGQQNVVSGELSLSDNETEDTRAEFLGTTSSTGFTSGSVVASFQLRMDSNDPASSSSSGKYIAHFIGDNDEFDAPNFFLGRVFVNNGAGTDFKLGISNFSSSTTSFFATELSSDTNYDLTLTFDIDNGTSSLSVAGLGTISATDAAATVARMNSFGFRQTSTTGDQFIDNLTVNTVAAVPEPSAFLFGGLVCSVLGVKFARQRKLS